MAGIAPASATPDCTPRQIEEWPVRLVHNHLVIDGAINGHKVGVMLDTGAAMTLILKPAAARLGLDSHYRRGSVRGIGGESDPEQVLIDEFKLGDATRKDWWMLVAGEHDVGEDIAVLLGENFLSRVDVEFDLAHNAVRLFQQGSCGSASLAYWAPRGAHEVAIAAVANVAPRIILPVSINGKTISAIFDSGASQTVVHKAVAARLGITPETPGVVAAGKTGGVGPKAVDTWIAPFRSVSIAGETVSNARLAVADLGAMTPMLLGADFLQAHRIMVAHSQRKIYFTNVGGWAFGPATSVAGSSDVPRFKWTGASCQYSSECGGDVGCVGGTCQRVSNAADQCISHTECAKGEWCIGSPRRCQALFPEGSACSKDADCEGKLKCLSDRCATPN
jgi:clan AA aspartic protease (TIGR02281 family)